MDDAIEPIVPELDHAGVGLAGAFANEERVIAFATTQHGSRGHHENKPVLSKDG